MQAEVIAVGDEITSGQLLDTNSQWLSLRLEELGIRVLYHSTVGDELAAMVEIFRQALARADVIVVTGGLGPTADDLTRDALAEAVGRKLVFDPDAMEHIRGLFARRHRPMPEQNRLQAMFPEGSGVIPNPHGTAPGIDLVAPRAGGGSARLFALPGVPDEMKEMWHATLRPALEHSGAGAERICHRRIKCFGAGESQIESMLPDLIRRGRQPRVGINASGATIILRITAAGATEAQCRAAMEPTVATIREHLGNLVYGEEDDELQDVVLRRLAQRGQTLATVEWYTTGLLSQGLAAAAGSASTYRGGLVVGGVEALSGALGGLPFAAETLVGADRQAARSAVEQVARLCRERMAADFALCIGPLSDNAAPADEESGAGDAGMLAVALAGPRQVGSESIRTNLHPAIRKVYCVKRALNLLRLAMDADAG